MRAATSPSPLLRLAIHVLAATSIAHHVKTTQADEPDHAVSTDFAAMQIAKEHPADRSLAASRTCVLEFPA